VHNHFFLLGSAENPMIDLVPAKVLDEYCKPGDPDTQCFNGGLGFNSGNEPPHSTGELEGGFFASEGFHH